ncbi:DUF1428 domain-containing protein [Falsiroseomonas tokyonensis]|uniref:DUF1428 domain-containing protein n=1 Tax=Falsiroseomonas tokyonensis TaxID=430521 RepID=A0ABV7BYM5_9PROT|nr:DUF1428 domain-containing protein [Falsiroseomonas tokyonensis]MBU8540676.1 DUF1428 domain-containing protein [Falsiroseomonas tokyonensis]
MSYIDGMVAAVPATQRAAYLAHARLFQQLVQEFGALRAVECWGDDVPDGEVTDFRRAVQAGADEGVVLSWIEWPSRAIRDAGMQRLMQDARMKDTPMPFDGSRMIHGGFLPILDSQGEAP